MSLGLISAARRGSAISAGLFLARSAVDDRMRVLHD
jgi:hypothetical protein